MNNSLCYKIIIIIFAFILLFEKKQLIATEKFIVEINVPHNSFFSIEKYFSAIKKGKNILGRFSFKNNTQDGFKLSIISTNGGNLKSNDISEDIFSIPYILTLNPIDKSLDNSVVEVLTPDLHPNIEVPFLYLTGSAQEMSYGYYEVAIYIEDTTNALEMAGNYQDSIMIKYSDL